VSVTIEVPVIGRLSTSLRMKAETIWRPGAKRSTQGPKLEKLAR
jgi:hypothetical protein